MARPCPVLLFVRPAPRFGRRRLGEHLPLSGRRGRVPRPGAFFALFDVDMAVDVVHAVAVIAVALGAVAEFHVGVVGVGNAAHGTFVQVALCFLGLLLGLFEVDGLRRGFVSDPAEQGGKVPREEQEIVQDGNDGDQSYQELTADQIKEDGTGEKRRVDPGQPLDLDRDNEENQEPGLGVEGGEGEEHRQIDIIHGGKARHETQQGVEENAHKVEQGELDAAPLPFQGGADHPVEVQRNRQEKQIAVQGDKDEGDQPPDLTVQDLGDAEEQKLRTVTLAEHVQQIDNHGADDNVVHQMGDAQFRVLITKTVQPRINRTQWQDLPIYDCIYCTRFLANCLRQNCEHLDRGYYSL